VWTTWLDQAMPDSEGRSGCPVLAARLIENVGQVIGDGFLAEVQLLGDLGAGQSLCY
jgi:hypothetical protein